MSPALALIAALLAAPAGKPDGKALFAAKCAVCHGDDARGQTAYGKQHAIPDFTSKDFAAKHGEKEITATVTDGDLEADMPAFGKDLSAEQIKAVAGYIHGLSRK